MVNKVIYIFLLLPLAGKANINICNQNEYHAADTSSVTNTLTLSTTYGNNASFFGRANEIKYPYLTTDITFTQKSGLWLYGAASKVFNSSPAVDEVDLSAGYDHKFSKKFKSSISYTRFIFSNQSEILKSSASNDINLTNSLKWQLLKTTLAADYLFGTSNDFFLSFKNSKNFETKGRIFDNKDYLSFEPSATIILGTQDFVTTYVEEHPLQPNGKRLKKALNPPVYSAPITRYNKKFQTLNYNFKLPIAYNRPHYSLESAWKYSIPVNTQSGATNKPQSFFTLNFYYIFY